MEHRRAGIVLTLICLAATSVALNSKGRDFVAAFLENEVEYWQGLGPELWIVNDNSFSVNVQISAPKEPSLLRPNCTGATSVAVGGRSTHKFTACWWGRVSPYDNSISRKSFRIESDGDISVIGLNKDTFSADSFLVLPVNSLGTSYYVMDYGYQTGTSQVAVVGTTDRTSLNIYLPSNLEGPDMSVNYRCLIYKAREQLNIQIHAYEVFHIDSKADLTGLRVMSSDPVAVFAGNIRTGVPIESTSRDHLAEQMISSGNWDTEYVYQPISKVNPLGDYVKFLSAKDGATVTLRYANGSNTNFNLNEGEWRQLHLTQVAYISSTVPISVAVITLSQDQPETIDIPTDPTLLMLPGLKQLTNRFTIPPYRSAISTHPRTEKTLNDAQKYTDNTFFAVIRSSEVNQVRMDGQIPSIRYPCQSVPSVEYQVCGYSFDGQNSHTFTLANGADFGGFVFSSTDRESACSAVAVSAPPVCEPRVMRPGDTYDNDCDGRTDEESCDGIDDDSDGLVDEDCLRSTGEALGRRYLVAFIDNSKEDGQPGDLQSLEIYISPQNTVSSTRVDFNGAGLSESRTANAGETLQFNVSETFRMPRGSGIYNLGIMVNASDDIVLYAINKIKFSSESYLGIPLDVTGFDHYVACTTNRDGGDAAELAACAAGEGQTEVRVTLGKRAVTVSYNGQQYGAGDTISVSLEMQQCLQLQDSGAGDLTGSRVQSINSKRISVFSGNRRPKILSAGESPTVFGSRDHIVEQIPPITAWGRQFFTNPVKRDGQFGEVRGDFFRVITSRANTRVIVVSSVQGSSNTQTVTLPDAGDFLEMDVAANENLNIRTDNPSLVVQLTKTQDKSGAREDDIGDPAMSLVVPKEAWSNNYRFVTPYSGQADTVNGGYLPYTNRMSIIIEDQYKDLLIYGDQSFTAAFPNAEFKTVPNSNPAVVATTVEVGFGQNFVTAQNNVTFSATIYGAADREFFMNPISLRLSSSACVITVMVQGDNLDNDCDGEINEEACNGLDDDNDGQVDEDCAADPVANGQALITFMSNIVEYPTELPLNVYVFGSCAGESMIRFRTPNAVGQQQCDMSISVPFGEYRQFAPSDLFKQEGNGFFKRSMIVESDCADLEVSMFNMDRFSNDGAWSIPRKWLGREYYAFSYHPVTLGGQMTILASEAASVTITVPDNAVNNQVIDPTNNNTYTNGQTFNLNLEVYQSVQLTSQGDLTGARIQSDVDVAVWSGNVRVGIDSTSRDHIVEQLVPWNKAATQFVVIANGMTETEIVKLVCAPNAQVTFPRLNNGGNLVVGAGSQVEIPQDYAQDVTSTGNCQMVLITKSQRGAADGSSRPADPTMTVIVPPEHFVTRAMFVTPTASVGSYSSNLVITTRSSDTGNIQLDGNSVTGWTQISGSLYSYVRVEVQPRDNSLYGAHMLAGNGATFGATHWGAADRESFSYPVGMDLS